jgi:hypothetical protein
MRRRWLLGGVAWVLVLAGVGLAIRASQSDAKKTPASIASVTKAFAARGIALELSSQAALAPDEKGRAPLGILWNQPSASRQGLVTVVVLRSTADAQGVVRYTRRLDVSVPDSCGRKLALDYSELQSGNVFATFSRCDYTDSPNHLVGASARSTFVESMHDIAG